MTADRQSPLGARHGAAANLNREDAKSAKMERKGKPRSRSLRVLGVAVEIPHRTSFQTSPSCLS
jgi:hypothetical protein